MRGYVKYSLLGICITFSLVVCAQDDFDPGIRSENTIRIAFYNTENFFDVLDDPKKRDDEFTPNGDKHWDKYKFNEKQAKLAKVIIALGGWECPEIIGFCELENKGVLQSLIWQNNLKDQGYKIAHYESPDRRGIDVGLLYRSEKINLIYSEPVSINFPWDASYKTRDILYAVFSMNTIDTFHLFINHWPSRWGGQLESEPSRKFVASVLKSKTDSLLGLDKQAPIIIMGDFNDTPVNQSVSSVLGAQPQVTENPKDLVNLTAAFEGKRGTHKYQGDWAVLDQVIVSQSMVGEDNKLGVKEKKAYIFNAPFLLEPDEKFQGESVNRTYIGMKYHGGYSDHLPIYIDVELKP